MKGRIYDRIRQAQRHTARVTMSERISRSFRSEYLYFIVRARVLIYIRGRAWGRLIEGVGDRVRDLLQNRDL